MAISRKQRPISASEMRKALRNAAEEDERSSAEEEYRRAEERRREREEEKRRAVEEASRHAEEDRLIQEEASTRKKKGPPARIERKASETPHRFAEPQQPGQPSTQLPRTVPGGTVAAQEPPRDQPPAMKTIPAPDKFAFSQSASDSRETYQSQMAAPHKSKRMPLIVAAVALVILSGALIVWLVSRNSTTNFSLSNAVNNADPSSPNATGATNSSLSNSLSNMVLIPGGTFSMSRDKGDEAERPAHQVTVKPFYIDTYEVTNEDYEKFIKATGHRAPATWQNGSFPSRAARQPVTGVTWDDANDYARWIGKRLPTDEEWEFAARGPEDRLNHLYPWGKDWRQGSANANGASQSVADVGSYKGASPFGAYDMVGNAWEWTASDFRAYPGGRLPSNLPKGELKVIRGGSYESGPDVATTTFRFGWPARGGRYDQTGFRCAKDVAQ